MTAATGTTTIESFVESQVETLVQEDSYYQPLATSLKPPSAFRKQHREQLMDFFKFAELRAQLEEAPKIILELMPSLVTPEEFDKIKEELNKSSDHFLRAGLSMHDDPSEKPILFQELFGLSDDTLIHVYDLGVDLVKKSNYKDGNSLFAFLTTMAPHVASYWISQGVCLQALNEHEDAIAMFSSAKFLSPTDPAPSAYTIESHLILKNNDKAKFELDVLKNIVQALNGDEKTTWEAKIKEITI